MLRKSILHIFQTLIFSTVFVSLAFTFLSACDNSNFSTANQETSNYDISLPNISESDTIPGCTTSEANTFPPVISNGESEDNLTTHRHSQDSITSNSSSFDQTSPLVTQPAPSYPEPTSVESKSNQSSNYQPTLPPSTTPSSTLLPTIPIATTSPTIPAAPAVPAVPPAHKHTYTIIVTSPTCLEKGFTTQKCTSCSHSLVINLVEAIGHNYIETIVAPTCTNKGYSIHTCTRCADSYTDKETPSKGHIWSQWSVVKEPTKTSYGQKSRTCSVCSKTESLGLPPLQLTADELQQEVLKLVNTERQNAGLPPLSYCYEAQEAADIRVSEIQISYGHTRPNGKQCYTVIAECGIDVSMCGENIAFGFPSPQTIVEKWMESPGHRANILNKNISSLVVGVSGSYWVQLFIK